MSKRANTRSTLLRVLKPLVAIVILVLVFRMLPWTDVLNWTAADGGRVAVAGEIRGDWKTDRIEFRMDPESEVELPDWVTADPEATFHVERGGTLLLPAIEGGRSFGAEADWDPGMPTVFGSVKPEGVAMAMGLFFCAVLFGVTRWWRLLALVGCASSWWNVLRLTYLGLFFNLVMPGLTGGDVAKAVIVVREHPERRGRALMSVVVDRLIGLMTLALLALVVILISGETFAELRLPMLAFSLAGIGGAFVYFSRRLRRLLHFDALLDKLPLGDKLKKLDEAAQHYFAHPIELCVAAGLSLGNHAMAILAVWALGTSFGVTAAQVGVLDYFALVPIANIVSSLPIAPGGWGLGEYVYSFLFDLIGAPITLGVAVSVAFRLCQVLLSLLGGLFLLVPGARAELQELEDAEVESHPS